MPATQQPKYADPVALERAVAALSRLPPLVVSWEIEALRAKLAQAQRGEQFLLQGGDCAESFEDCESDNIAKRLKILLQMSLVLLQGLKKPIIRVGRFAGQYAKPRSADTETRAGVTLPSLPRRQRQPAGLHAPRSASRIRSCCCAATSAPRSRLNFVRALIDGGFADLHHPEYWDLGFLRHAALRDAYQKIVDSIAESLEFFESMSGLRVHAATRVEFYTSHEGLHLLSEQAQTRYIERQKKWYNLSTHMPWIGMRTANIDGAHIEYFRGIANPIGVKVGAAMSAEWLQELVAGAESAEPAGPAHVHPSLRHQGHRAAAARDDRGRARHRLAGAVGVRSHARQYRDHGGRRQDAALRQYSGRGGGGIPHSRGAAGRVLGGVHIELTGEDVTECIGGARGLKEADLARAYKSQVDPRLNAEQALELAMLIARRGRARRASQAARGNP